MEKRLPLLKEQYPILDTWKVKAFIGECKNPLCDNPVYFSKHARNKKYCSKRCRLDAQHERQKRQRALTRRLRIPDTANRFILNSINECLECKSRNIIYDFERREIVCGDCGLVLDIIKY